MGLQSLMSPDDDSMCKKCSLLMVEVQCSSGWCGAVKKWGRVNYSKKKPSVVRFSFEVDQFQLWIWINKVLLKIIPWDKIEFKLLSMSYMFLYVFFSWAGCVFKDIFYHIRYFIWFSSDLSVYCEIDHPRGLV